MNCFVLGIDCPTAAPPTIRGPGSLRGPFFDLDVRQSHTDLQVETPEAFPR
jgi:hypothetical protein